MFLIYYYEVSLILSRLGRLTYYMTMEHNFLRMSMQSALYLIMCGWSRALMARKFYFSYMMCYSSIIMDLSAYTLPVLIFVHLLTKPLAPQPIFSPTQYFSSNSDVYLMPENISGVEVLGNQGVLAILWRWVVVAADFILFQIFSELRLIMGIWRSELRIVWILLFLYYYAMLLFWLFWLYCIFYFFYYCKYDYFIQQSKWVNAMFLDQN